MLKEWQPQFMKFGVSTLHAFWDPRMVLEMAAAARRGFQVTQTQFAVLESLLVVHGAVLHVYWLERGAAGVGQPPPPEDLLSVFKTQQQQVHVFGL